MTKKNLFVFENTYTLNNHILRQWYRLAQSALDEHRTFNVALSGEKALIPFYNRLGAIIDYDYWPRTHLFLADEYFSDNFKQGHHRELIRHHLTSTIDLETEHIHFITNDQTLDVIQRGRAYEADLLKFFRLKLNQAPVFDLVLLAMNPQGRLEAWQPDILRLSTMGRFTMSFSSKYLQRAYIALSPAVINQARHIMIVAREELDLAVVDALLGKRDDVRHYDFLRSARGQLSFLFDRKTIPQPSVLTEFYPYQEAVCHPVA